VNVGVEQTRNTDRETRIEELRIGESPSANRLGLPNDRLSSSSSPPVDQTFGDSDSSDSDTRL